MLLLPGTEGQKRPASRAYEHGHVVDWSKEPYARGAYTYPSLGAHVNDRSALIPPIAVQGTGLPWSPDDLLSTQKISRTDAEAAWQ